MERSIALVTGASSGIGYEFARILARENFDLVLTARNKKALTELKARLMAEYEVKVEIIAKDLASVSSVQDIYDQLKKENIVIDVLINNAGLGDFGFFHEMDWRKQEEIINVNITALTRFCHLFGKDMVARRRGKILNVASTAAFQPGPLQAVYYASKAFVVSFSEAIGNEFKDAGVSVTTLCPGPTATEFHKRAGMKRSKLFSSIKIAPARDVAWYGYQAMMKGKAIAIPGLRNWFLAFATRFAPRGIVVKAVRRMQEERGK